MSYDYAKNIAEAKEELIKLNASLNALTGFKEIAKAMSMSLSNLFKDSNWALYILENDQYYIESGSDIASAPQAIQPKKKLDRIFTKDILDKAIVDYRIFDKNTTDYLYKNNIINLFAFPGRNKIIALLFTNKKNQALFQSRRTLHLFQKIQNKAGIFLENSTLSYDLDKRNQQISYLFEAGEKVLSSLDTEKILDFILTSLKEIIPFDASVIFLLDSNGTELLSSNSMGYTEAHNKKLHLKIGEGACGWVAKNQKTDIIYNIESADHYYKLRKKTKSQITIPLLFNKKTLGVLCLESDRTAFFRHEDAELLNIYGHLAATAIHNAKQFQIEIAKQAFEHELVNAAAVQKRLLIQRIPRIKKLELSAENIPSKIVSGDLFDIIRYGEEIAGVAIGDVSGKGAPAALMMSLLLAGLRAHKKTFLTVCDIVYRLNNLLYESTIEGKYATFFYGVFSMTESKLYYSNAGHNPPVIIKDNGSIIELKTGGIVLGFIEDYSYKQDVIDLEKDDLFFAYTDGVSETMNMAEEEFGDQRLIELVKNNRKKSVQEIRKVIKDSLKKYSANQFNEDDMTILLAKIL
jgi:sigma-B regulation protein RsbU (phosphoserine phosphatase)